jgi:hypothetical protein
MESERSIIGDEVREAEPESRNEADTLKVNRETTEIESDSSNKSESPNEEEIPGASDADLSSESVPSSSSDDDDDNY